MPRARSTSRPAPCTWRWGSSISPRPWPACPPSRWNGWAGSSPTSSTREPPMKIVRVRLAGDEIAYGAVEPEGIRVHQGTPFVAWEPTETLVPFGQAHLLAPVFPTKVVAVGRNYAGHAAERGVAVPS